MLQLDLICVEVENQQLELHHSLCLDAFQTLSNFFGDQGEVYIRNMKLSVIDV